MIKAEDFVVLILFWLMGPGGDTVCPTSNGSWSFLYCPEEDECANAHHHCNATQDCHDLAEGFHCTCKHGYLLSR